MDKLIIQKHNFDKSLCKLKQLSSTMPDNCTLTKVAESGGLLGLGSHKVTGQELNQLTGIIQNKLISINNTLINFHKEFGTVYNTLNTLDNEYIAGILTVIEDTQRVSSQTLSTQEDVNKTIEVLKKTANAFKEFKDSIYGDIAALSLKIGHTPNSLSNCDHLNDIDSMWNDLIEQKEGLLSLDASLRSVADGLLRDIDSLNQKLLALLDRFESIVHLNDIDAMWDLLQTNTQNLVRLENELNLFSIKVDGEISEILSRVEILAKFKEQLESLTHLKDVDTMWDLIESANTEISSIKQSIDSYATEFSNAINSVNNSINSLEESICKRNAVVDKRFKILWWLIGSGIALVVANYVLQITCVL